MRTSKLFRLSCRTGLDRKLNPLPLTLARGYSLVKAAASGSGVVMVLFANGTPHRPVGLPGLLERPVCRVSKISPAKVGLPLQSSVGEVMFVFGSVKKICVVGSSCARKFPLR